MTRANVPIQKRATVWISSVVTGLAMYFVFVSIFTITPARERDKVRGKTAGLMAQSLATPRKASAEEVKVSMSESRARTSVLGALQKWENELSQACRAKRFWAVIIGLVAGGGCFALGSVYWVTRGAKEAVVLG